MLVVGVELDSNDGVVLLLFDMVSHWPARDTRIADHQAVLSRDDHLSGRVRYPAESIDVIVYLVEGELLLQDGVRVSDVEEAARLLRGLAVLRSLLGVNEVEVLRLVLRVILLALPLIVDVPHEQATLLLALDQLVARSHQVLLQGIPRDAVALSLLVVDEPLLDAVWQEGFPALVLARLAQFLLRLNADEQDLTCRCSRHYSIEVVSAYAFGGRHRKGRPLERLDVGYLHTFFS